MLNPRFEIVYRGILPLRHVRTRCTIDYAANENMLVTNSDLGGRTFGDVEAGDRFTSNCSQRDMGPQIGGISVLQSEIALRIEYSLPLLPGVHQKEFVFATEPGADAKLIWVPIAPMEKKIRRRNVDNK